MKRIIVSMVILIGLTACGGGGSDKTPFSFTPDYPDKLSGFEDGLYAKACVLAGNGSAYLTPFVEGDLEDDAWHFELETKHIVGLTDAFLLVQYIRLLDYRAAGIAVWFIAITVAILDFVSSEIRQRFV